MVVFVREFDHLVDEQSAGKSAANVAPISREDFDFLESRLYTPDEETRAELTHFIRPSMVGGRRSLQVRNFVGVLQTPAGTQIEILPKIYGGKGAWLDLFQVRRILLRMLSCLPDAPFRQDNPAELSGTELPLLELFIRYFLQAVSRLVKKGIRSDYKSSRENLSYLKGKLLLDEHIRCNLIHQHRFFVEFDSYLPNRAENRLIHTTLQKLLRATRRNANRQLCRELLLSFDGIPVSSDIDKDLAHIFRDRNIAHYQHVLEWCELLLKNQSPFGPSDDTLALSLLFPMERLFENYVANRLRQLYPDWTTTLQAKRKTKHLASQGTRKLFALKPDLILENGKRRLVADTKWKNLGAYGTRPLHRAISRQDLYQMFAYGHNYLDTQDNKELYLIYPRSERFSEPLEEFDLGGNMKLYVVPFDLTPEEDRLLLAGNCMLNGDQENN